MEALIQQLRVAVSAEPSAVALTEALKVVTKIVQQLKQDKLPNHVIKEVATEIVEAVLAELPPSSQGVSTMLRPLMPSVIDSGLGLTARCLSWLYSFFSPKIVVKPLLTSVVAAVEPARAAAAAVGLPVENLVLRDRDCLQCKAWSVVHDGPVAASASVEEPVVSASASVCQVEPLPVPASQVEPVPVEPVPVSQEEPVPAVKAVYSVSIPESLKHLD